MNDLDIGVIYTYEREDLQRLLDGLRGSIGDLRARVILVDNASEDGTDAWEKQFAPTRVLRNGQRLFYAANLNRVLQASAARYVLLLNTDVSFDPDERSLAKMVAFMDRHPRCGMAGCRVLHLDGAYAYSARRFQTPATIVARRLGLGGLMRGELDRYLYRDRDPAGSWECDWLSGCFLLLRRETYGDVGSFDTRFVKYFEDVDYCLRVARAGWQVMYHGGTYCYHREARASRRLVSADAWLHLRAYVRWLRKWGLRAPQAAPAPAGLRRAA